MNQETPPATTDFAAWIGRTEQSDDPLAATQALAAAALFDLDPAPLCEGAPLPPLWHWFYFLPRAPQALLDEDGHPRRGGFLPPIPYPRRMFAGSRLRLTSFRGSTPNGGTVSGSVNDEPADDIPYMTPNGKLAVSGVARVEAGLPELVSGPLFLPKYSPREARP